MLDYSTANNGRSQEAGLHSHANFGDPTQSRKRVMSFKSFDQQEFSYEDFVVKQDRAGKLVLKYILSTEKERFKAIDVRQNTGLTKPVVQHRLEGFKQEILLVEKAPHQNPNMPPTYIYELAHWVDLERLKAVLDSHLSNQDVSSPKVGKSENSPIVFSETLLYSDLEKAFEQIRQASRKEHAETALTVAKLGQATVVQVTEASVHARKQTKHAQLERLRGLKIVHRKKNGGSYSYTVTPGITVEQLEALIRRYSHQTQEQSETSQPAQITAIQEFPVMPTLTQDHSKNNAFSAQKPETYTALDGFWAELIMSKFPAFDPSWSDEEIEKWWSGISRVIQLGKIEQG